MPRVAGNRVAYRDGVPLATRVAGEISFLADLAPADRVAASESLRREPRLSWAERNVALPERALDGG